MLISVMTSIVEDHDVTGRRHDFQFISPDQRSKLVIAGTVGGACSVFTAGLVFCLLICRRWIHEKQRMVQRRRLSRQGRPLSSQSNHSNRNHEIRNSSSASHVFDAVVALPPLPLTSGSHDGEPEATNSRNASREPMTSSWWHSQAAASTRSIGTTEHRYDDTVEAYGLFPCQAGFDFPSPTSISDLLVERPRVLHNHQSLPDSGIGVNDEPVALPFSPSSPVDRPDGSLSYQFPTSDSAVDHSRHILRHTAPAASSRPLNARHKMRNDEHIPSRFCLDENLRRFDESPPGAEFDSWRLEPVFATVSDRACPLSTPSSGSGFSRMVADLTPEQRKHITRKQSDSGLQQHQQWWRSSSPPCRLNLVPSVDRPPDVADRNTWELVNCGPLSSLMKSRAAGCSMFIADRSSGTDDNSVFDHARLEPGSHQFIGNYAEPDSAGTDNDSDIWIRRMSSEAVRCLSTSSSATISTLQKSLTSRQLPIRSDVHTVASLAR